jgi:hypothetical protein
LLSRPRSRSKRSHKGSPLRPEGRTHASSTTPPWDNSNLRPGGGSRRDKLWRSHYALVRTEFTDEALFELNQEIKRSWLPKRVPDRRVARHVQSARCACQEQRKSFHRCGLPGESWMNTSAARFSAAVARNLTPSLPCCALCCRRGGRCWTSRVAAANLRARSGMGPSRDRRCSQPRRTKRI